jgi:thioredoxin 1
MVRSKAVLAGLIVLVLAVVVVKVARTPRAAAKTETPPPTVERTPTYVLEGKDLAASLRNGKPTLVDFGEGSCEQCRKQAPVLVATARRYRGKANVVFVDTRVYAEIGRAYNIVAIPTQIFFDVKGREISRHVGYSPPEDLAEELTKVGAT